MHNGRCTVRDVNLSFRKTNLFIKRQICNETIQIVLSLEMCREQNTHRIHYSSSLSLDENRQTIFRGLFFISGDESSKVSLVLFFLRGRLSGVKVLTSSGIDPNLSPLFIMIESKRQ